MDHLLTDYGEDINTLKEKTEYVNIDENNVYTKNIILNENSKINSDHDTGNILLNNYDVVSVVETNENNIHHLQDTYVNKNNLLVTSKVSTTDEWMDPYESFTILTNEKDTVVSGNQYENGQIDSRHTPCQWNTIEISNNPIFEIMGVSKDFSTKIFINENDIMINDEHIPFAQRNENEELHQISINTNGTLFSISTMDKNAYIFKKVNNEWTFIDNIIGNAFLSKVSDNDTILVSNPDYQTKGSILIYQIDSNNELIGDTFQYEFISEEENSFYGNDISISNDGLLFTSIFKSPKGIYISMLSTLYENTWTQKGNFLTFDECIEYNTVSLSGNGQSILCEGTNSDQQQKVAVFQYINGFWTLCGPTFTITNPSHFSHNINETGDIISIFNNSVLEMYHYRDEQWFSIGNNINVDPDIMNHQIYSNIFGDLILVNDKKYEIQRMSFTFMQVNDDIVINHDKKPEKNTSLQMYQIETNKYTTVNFITSYHNDKEQYFVFDNDFESSLYISNKYQLFDQKSTLIKSSLKIDHQILDVTNAIQTKNVYIHDTCWFYLIMKIQNCL